MNRTRTWTLALLAGLLGGGDWFLATLPADGHPGLQPELRIDEGLVNAYLQDAGTGEDRKKHIILTVPRKKTAVRKVTVRLHEIPDNSNSRYAFLGFKALEQVIPLDEVKARPVDLGAPPARKSFYTLTASVDDRNFVPLLWWLSK